MKSCIDTILLVVLFLCLYNISIAQNVGIGTLTPSGKLHIKGLEDISQLIIDGNSTQSSISPLIKLRNSNGIDLLWLHADDSSNVFLGLKAGRVNVIGPQGVNNTFLGSQAGYSNTNGRDNTLIGTNAMYNNTKASWNTAVGTNALFSQSFSPPSAWWTSANVAVGYEALYSNQPTNSGNGVNNTAIGTSSLRTNTTGAENTAVGRTALYNNSTGTGNMAAGASSLNANTIGNFNIANGKNALYSNTSASYNIAVGYNALYTQSFNPGVAWSSHNVAVGYEALYSNQPTSTINGFGNTAVGNLSLRNNTIGYSNIATGYEALHANTTGYENIATGFQALFFNNSGNNNTAIGSYTLYNNTGDHNAASGSNALYNNTSGSYNTANGYAALYTNTTGSDNTALGYGANVIGGGLTHAMALGFFAVVDASYKVLVGDPNIITIGGFAGWTTYPSDSRFKNNIKENVPGLAFITKLNPITYTMDIEAIDARLYPNGQDHLSNADHKEISADEKSAKDAKSKIIYSGFIAQEVEKAAKDLKYEFSGVDAPKNDNDFYGLRYADFVVPLVKAVQEQQMMINQLIDGMEDMKKRNEELQYRLETLENSTK